jgi:ABC-2 type transport system permease protein
VSDLRAMLVVARRELLERVRSKWFVVMTLIGPIGMVAMIVVPALIGSGGAGTKVDILDNSGRIGTPLKLALESEQWIATIVDPATSDAVELEKLRGKHLNGYIRISSDALDRPAPSDATENTDKGAIVYTGDNASNATVKFTLEKTVQSTVSKLRALDERITDAQLARINARVSFASNQSNGETEGTSGMAAFAIAYILAFILYMVITLYGVAVMRSVVTEKTSRVMELMVAAVKPRSLMGGKILGVGAAGLIQIAVWLAMGAITLAYKDSILGWFGAKGGGGVELPPLAFGEIFVVIIYFILGFFFYSSMYAAVGAMVSSEQDTQQVQLPVTMLLVIGVVSLQVVSGAPRGTASTVMSNVPLWSPIMMPMRYVLGGATAGEVAISLAILVLSTALVVRAAAKIYRVGVLMYGKRPGLSELIRWLRY